MEKQQQPGEKKITGGEEEEEVISSVRYRGWKSMPYVIGNETFEKLGTIGTTANLLVYLTTVYHLPSVHAATLLNFFSGTTNLAPLLGAFLSDTFLGRYTTIAAASLASCLGMLLLTLTAAIPSLHPPPSGHALQMDRRLTRWWAFEVPAGSMVVFNMMAMTVWIPVYDRVVVPALRRVTGKEGGISQLQRIGVGLVLSVATMVVAAAVEQRRRRLGAVGVKMSFLWLVPQQVAAGMSEAFAAIGQTELYYRQFPENMRSVAGALFFLAFALANYASGFMVAAVHRTTGWLAQDLNHARLDLFYLTVAAIAAANVCYFLLCARWYRFKNTTIADHVELPDYHHHQPGTANTIGSKV
uniref:Major facilitator superfamily (MFS) profile domain-containing protein n=1 Tax=Oryza barthii TaxID=65489 RepID=A0A0D3HX68_9ORYZ